MIQQEAAGLPVEAQPRYPARRRPLATVLTPGVVALGLLAIGAVLRLYRLDARSLWLDELVTASAMRLHSLGEVMAYVNYWIANMPLIFVQLWLLRGLGGSEIIVRLPFVVAGTLNIFALYYLGKTIARPRVGLLAALLMAVGPFAVWYSQEARQYAPLMLLTTLQMLFAYRAVTAGRARDWAALVICSVLNLYTGYLALPVTAAAFTFIGLALLDTLRRVWIARRTAPATSPHLGRTVGLQIGAALIAGAAIGASYLPWWPTFQVFLAHPDLGFGELDPTVQFDLLHLWGILLGLDLSGLVLVLAVIGLAASIVGLVRGHARSGALLLIWLALPLAVFWYNARDAIAATPVRYFSFLYPVALLFVALGAESVTLGVRWLATRWRRGRPRLPLLAGGAWGVIIALLLLQLLPALAQSYARPKEDYRGAATLLTTDSPPSTVVLAMGEGTVVSFNESLDYYFWLQYAPQLVEDARQVDVAAADRLAHGASAAWGLVYGRPDATATTQAQAVGFQVIPLVGLTLLRPPPGESPIAQAQALLRWGGASDPRLLPGVDLLDAVAGTRPLGANLLAPVNTATPPGPGVGLLSGHEPAGRWLLWPGAALSADASAVVLTPHEQEVNATFITAPVTPGQTYALFFRYRNPTLDGAQRVYVSAHSADGRWLDTFPGGLGYRCLAAADWTRQGFALRVPAETATLRVWLRATGHGAAEFADVELRPIP